MFLKHKIKILTFSWFKFNIYFIKHRFDLWELNVSSNNPVLELSILYFEFI